VIRFNENYKAFQILEPELMEVSQALKERASAFDRFGAESPQYIAADGRFLAAKEALRKVRGIGT